MMDRKKGPAKGVSAGARDAAFGALSALTAKPQPPDLEKFSATVAALPTLASAAGAASAPPPVPETVPLAVPSPAAVDNPAPAPAAVQGPVDGADNAPAVPQPRKYRPRDTAVRAPEGGWRKRIFVRRGDGTAQMTLRLRQEACVRLDRLAHDMSNPMERKATTSNLLATAIVELVMAQPDVAAALDSLQSTAVREG